MFTLMSQLFHAMSFEANSSSICSTVENAQSRLLFHISEVCNLLSEFLKILPVTFDMRPIKAYDK